jgi:16S rRNA (guanine966-N2)-methyltransferase
MKLRIIAGSLGGRQFNPPKGHHTHPMSERIRGAVFNVLGDVSGLTVLDGFAGSGAVAFEALSRGAKSALLIENDTEAVRAITENVEVLNLSDKVQTIQGNVNGWSGNHQGQAFDLVFCDPPYDAVPSTLIQKLSRHVAPKGTLILSWPSFVDLPDLPNMDMLSSKVYGNASLAFYKKTG